MVIDVLEFITKNEKELVRRPSNPKQYFPKTANDYQWTHTQAVELPEFSQSLLYSVGVDNVRFLKPIPITFTKEHRKLFIESEELEVVEMGDSHQDAIHNFVQYIVDQFATLSNYAESDRLTEKARRLLNIYEEYMKFEKTK